MCALTWLALLLAGTAGGVDAIGWLTLDGIFVAHMSGNTVGVTTHVALGQWPEVARRAFAIISFLVGLAFGAASTTATRRDAQRESLAPALAIEAALLVAVLFGGEAASHGARAVPRHPWPAYYGLVAVAAAAMGVQSATLRRVGHARLRTTYVTGVLTRFVEGLVKLATLPHRRHGRPATEDDEWRETAGEVRLLGVVWLAYALGGISAGLLTVGFGFRAVALPLAALIVAIWLDARASRARRPDAPC